MKKRIKIGIFIGALIGIIGTAVTQLTGDISIISIPIAILFRSYGLLFAYPWFELLITVAFYSFAGGIVGYLLEKKQCQKYCLYHSCYYLSGLMHQARGMQRIRWGALRFHSHPLPIS